MQVVAIQSVSRRRRSRQLPIVELARSKSQWQPTGAMKAITRANRARIQMRLKQWLGEPGVILPSCDRIRVNLPRTLIYKALELTAAHAQQSNTSSPSGSDDFLNSRGLRHRGIDGLARGIIDHVMVFTPS
jgi:hypothetical protein